MLNNNQPLCANISRRRPTNIDKSIPNNKSEKDKKKHISQKHNNDASDFEHHTHEREYGHEHFKELALVADDHFHNHMQNNHANEDQAKVTKPRYTTTFIISDLIKMKRRRVQTTIILYRFTTINKIYWRHIIGFFMLSIIIFVSWVDIE